MKMLSPVVRNWSHFAKALARLLSMADKQELAQAGQRHCSVSTQTWSILEEYRHLAPDQVSCDQIQIPNFRTDFKGLETDFPCLAKQ